MSISERLNENEVQQVIKALHINTNGSNKKGWTSIKSPIRDDDHNPSFGLNVITGAWQDHGTSHSGDIVELVKNINGLDFKQAKSWIIEVTGNKLSSENGRSISHSKKPRITETYDYTDKRGHLLYQVVRYEPKSFRQRKPDGKGGWSWKLEDTPRVLYRLPRVFKAIQDEKGMCLVEGEKDVHTLEKFGVTATTNAMGAEKWRPEYTQALRGAKLVLIPDNDEPGLKHMQTIAEELKTVATVILIRLPDLESKEDITDWLQKGYTKDDLNQIIKNTPYYGTKPEKKKLDQVVKNNLDINTAPKIPDEVYDNLPNLLKNLCDLVDENHRKDVFLLSALPVIASHMPNVLACHRDGYYTPDLFTLIVAGPGTGKGIAGKSLKLGSALNAKLIKQSKEEILDWQQLSDEEKVTEKEPCVKSLLIPANSSSRAMYDSLEANGGQGLLFETEIDTMLNATSQDWGDFSDITRRAFHHEELSMNRMGIRYYIENPRLSICLTGTFDQFKKMFDNAENGNFSRYAFYTFNAPRVWQSHRPTVKSRDLDESITEVSERLCHMYELLDMRTKEKDGEKRARPLYVDIKPSQWDIIDDTFDEKMNWIEDLELNKHLHASNNRTAVIAMRIACIFSVLRIYEEEPGSIRMINEISPQESDITAALFLADTFMKHSLRLYHIMPKSSSANPKGTRFNMYYSALPDRFGTAEAEEIAKKMGIAKRTASRWLKDLTGTLLIRTRRGQYEKKPK
ncbi:MAG: DUF3987 domain-containing protein [Balneolales bacterium]